MAVFRLIICATAFLAVCVELGSARHVCYLEEVNNFDCDFQDSTLYGTCSIHGDPHFNTWDSGKFMFTGECEYVLAEYCDQSDVSRNDFRITANFDARPPPNSAQTVVVGVELTINGEDFGISKASGFIRGVGSTVVGDATVTRFSGTDPILDYIIRVEVGGVTVIRIWYCPKYHWLEISAHRETYFLKLCGMCGTFNDDYDDDVKTRSNKPASGPNGRRRRDVPTGSPGKLGDAWELDGTCP